jgi:ABC-type phosphate transport system substrate-binding protein
MTSFSARRIAACIASAAAVAVVAVPGTASAKSKGPVPDRGEQCSGVSIVGRGSTFQNPAQLVWQPGFNANTSTVGCSGSQGSKGTPKAEYRNKESADRGSGSCLKVFGAEKVTPNREYSFCGTDEAPNAKQKEEIESHKTGGEAESLETIPVLQGAVAVIVHLPEGCKASSEPTEEKGKLVKLGRLSLDDATVEGIYRGTINTWKQLIEAQGAHANDKLTCAVPAEEEEEISRIVRLDHSGTTHIFKAYLSLVNSAPFKAEPYEESYSGSSTGCGAKFPAEEKTWAEVSEACPNQRWPEAAHVVRPTESGNPGVVNKVNATPSSIGYADLAVAREYKFFSSKGMGGENKKGEQSTKFWAPMQDSSTAGVSYADPASKGDTEKVASSNCKNTQYVEAEEKLFPPASTRSLWNAAKASLTEENYPICGLTYDLAFREYKPYLVGTPFEATGKATATTVENYLMYEVSSKGGGKEVKNHDYESLPTEVRKKAEEGIKTIGYAIP